MTKTSLSYFEKNIYAYRCEIIYDGNLYAIWKEKQLLYRLEITHVQSKHDGPYLIHYEIFIGNIILRLPQDIKNSEDWILYEFPISS